MSWIGWVGGGRLTEPMAELPGEYAGCFLAQVWRIRKVSKGLKFRPGGVKAGKVGPN